MDELACTITMGVNRMNPELGCVHVIGDNPSVMEGIKGDVYTLCEHVHKFTFDIVFGPLQQHLMQLPNMQVQRCHDASQELMLYWPSCG